MISDLIGSDLIWMVHIRSNLIRSNMDNIGSVITTDAMPSPLATEGAGDVDGRSRERHRDVRDGRPGTPPSGRRCPSGRTARTTLSRRRCPSRRSSPSPSRKRCPSRRTSPSPSRRTSPFSSKRTSPSGRTSPSRRTFRKEMSF